METIFEKIYSENRWDFGSGEGSLPRYTKTYRCFLQNFLRTYEIKSVVDFGCGDWQSSRLIDWSGVRYTGLDIVRAVIDRNQHLYQTENIEFHLTDSPPKSLPRGDLLIVKDVLQHWSTAAVMEFLPLVSRYRYALLTNCVAPRGTTRNEDTEDGGFRYLDLSQKPFAMAVTPVCRFTNRQGLSGMFQRLRWKKVVHLHEGVTLPDESKRTTRCIQKM